MKAIFCCRERVRRVVIGVQRPKSSIAYFGEICNSFDTLFPRRKSDGRKVVEREMASSDYGAFAWRIVSDRWPAIRACIELQCIAQEPDLHRSLFLSSLKASAVPGPLSFS